MSQQQTTKGRVLRIVKPNPAATVTPPAKARKVTTSVVTPEPGVLRSVSGLAVAQTFASPVVNKNKSRTVVKVDSFGLMTDAALTDRDLAGLRAIKQRHGGRMFPRQDIDAGIIRRLGERGKIEYVDGDLSTENARFKLTRAGLAL